MAETTLFELVSPDSLIMSKEVTMVVVPGAEGLFGVLPRHSPLLSTLIPGVISESPETNSKRPFSLIGRKSSLKKEFVYRSFGLVASCQHASWTMCLAFGNIGTGVPSLLSLVHPPE